MTKARQGSAAKPLLAPALAFAALGVTAYGLYQHSVVAPSVPHQLVGRVWFDHLPASRADATRSWVWLPSGLAVYQDGTPWRSSVEVFAAERRGDVVSLKAPPDGPAFDSNVAVKKCDERRPFTLCLTLETPARGPQEYFAFDDSDDTSAVPWAAALLKEADVRAALASGSSGAAPSVTGAALPPGSSVPRP